MKYFRYIVFTIFTAAFFSIPAIGQETQTRVVDEVVAQINEGVITLSRIKKESKAMVETFVQDGKSREEAQRIVDEKRGELIAGLINEELIVQRAKDMGIDSDIEAAVNERFVEVMKQFNLKTIESLYAEMEKTGVDPKELRETWRKQIIRERVIQRDVQGKIYWGLSGKELKDYYEKNKVKFTKPETISISEIFLGFAGRDESGVRDRAKQLHTQIKGGADFDTIAKDNSDPGLITQGRGKAEQLTVADLVESISTPLKGLKQGDITAPFEIERLGVIILRVDARDQASSESIYDESAVRLAIMTDRVPEEQKKYMAKLRNDSYIKISESYRPLVAPALYADERKDTDEKNP